MEDGDCTICLEPLMDELNALPCGHVFHSDCIVQALRVKSFCPQCRRRSTQKDVIRLFFKVASNSKDGDSYSPRHALDTNKLSKNYENKITLLRQQITKMREDSKAADKKFQKWEEYSEQMKTTFKQIEGQVVSLKKEKEKLKTELSMAQKTVVTLESQLKKTQVNHAFTKFIETNNMEVLENEMNNPAQIIAALKLANKFRMDQYQKLIKRQQEKAKNQENIRPSAVDDRSPRKKLKRTRPLKTLPAFNMQNSQVLSSFDDVIPSKPSIMLPGRFASKNLLPMANKDHLKRMVENVRPTAAGSKPTTTKTMSIMDWLK